MNNKHETEPDQFSPFTEPNAPEVFTSSVGAPPAKSPLKKALLIALLIVLSLFAIGAIVLVVILSLFFKGITDWNNQCSIDRAQLFSQEPAISAQFNKLAFVPGQPDVKAISSKQEGDCLDSRPAISETKTYTVSATAGEALQNVERVLLGAGYTASTNEVYAPGNPCKYQGKPIMFTAQNPHREVTITMTCSQYLHVDQGWEQTPVTQIEARLYVESLTS